MDALSLEELLSLAAQEGNSPGAQLYLYRLLHLLASRESLGANPVLLSYPGAKRLAVRLGLSSQERLAALFHDLGLGRLQFSIAAEGLQVTLEPAFSPELPFQAGQVQAGAWSSGQLEAGAAAGCELERGLIDGTLEQITGIPVTSRETQCCTRGDSQCVFEAVRQDFMGAPAYLPSGGIMVAGQAAFTAPLFNEPANPAFGQAAQAAVMGYLPQGAGYRPAPGNAAFNQPSFGPNSYNQASFGQPSNQPANGANGLGLRAWFLDLAGRELARARRHGRPVAVLYIDLDDLGAINAAHGRFAGDQVINAVAAALSKSCRVEDYLWHHGEDEFALMLSETDSIGAEMVAQRLITEILSAAEYVDVAARVSASIGFSAFPAHADSVPSLLGSARSALYVAKSLGKSRFHAASGRASKGDSRSTVGRARDGATSSETGAGAVGASVGNGQVAGADAPLDRRAPAASNSSVSRQNGGGPGEAHVVVSGTEKAGTSTAEKPGEREHSLEAASIMLASTGPMLLEGMRQVVAGQNDFRIVAEINRPNRLCATVNDLRPDVIFCDMAMASHDEFNLSKLIRESNLPCKMAVFANEADQEVIMLAADFSVDGVVLQESSPQEIVAFLKSVYQGKTVLPDDVRAAIAELQDNRRILGDLSDRELEVLRLVAEGKSNSQISDELFITVNTVRFHLANVYQKLGVSNRTGAANYYLRQDLNQGNQTKLL